MVPTIIGAAATEPDKVSPVVGDKAARVDRAQGALMLPGGTTNLLEPDDPPTRDAQETLVATANLQAPADQGRLVALVMTGEAHGRTALIAMTARTVIAGALLAQSVATEDFALGMQPNELLNSRSMTDRRFPTMWRPRTSTNMRCAGSTALLTNSSIALRGTW